METTEHKDNQLIQTIAILASVTFLYATVLVKLGGDWWVDENYSHGLLVPFVIAMIVWKEWDALKRLVHGPSVWLGGAIIVAALLMLGAGTLGAELFTQRVSLALMVAGIVVYLVGTQVFRILAVPFALFLLAIPIPQILFNRIAFPLQIWASQMAVWGIRLFEVPTLRKGNVIDILPSGGTQTISLEVVEACSGIRSLMTLVTLALILAYFTRRDDRGGWFANFTGPDFLRAVILMVSAVFIAVITNAARVTATGVSTYYYGKQATEGTIHDASGWLVYLVALALLIGTNYILKRVLRGGRLDLDPVERPPAGAWHTRAVILPLVAVIVVGGIGVNWFVNRGEVIAPRDAMSNLPAQLGDWRQKNDEIRFSEQTESVLRTTDYTMREYVLPDGRSANLYVGYYESQRTGATYHSPMNCLPGAGWVMRDPKYIEIALSDGRTFTANRYFIENGAYNEVMIYWYQGRGRSEANEYSDKINTIWDSVTRRRSDGAMVRIMTSVGADENAAVEAAIDLSARLAEQLDPYVPE